MQAMGGGHLRIGTVAHGQRESLKGERFAAIKPLLEAQPCIASVTWTDDPPGREIDFTGFRRRKVAPATNLIRWQAEHFGLEVSEEPWLYAPARKLSATIIARSSRYHTDLFPWAKIAQNNPDAVFVGLPEEHSAFEKYVGRRVRYAKTYNLLEVASIIAGADICYSNQTCAFWIACGLGVPAVQEMFRKIPNSIVRRGSIQYWTDGANGEVVRFA